MTSKIDGVFPISDTGIYQGINMPKSILYLKARISPIYTVELSSMQGRGARASKSSRFCEIRMSLAGDDDIRGSSVVSIRNGAAFGEGDEPKRGGLYDLRLGPSNRSFLCGTCLGTLNTCPGHLGHFQIKEKDYVLTQPLAIDEIKRWLSVVCHSCGSAMFPADIVQLPKSVRLQVAAEKAKPGDMCKICKGISGKIKPHKNPYLYIVSRDGDETILYPRIIREIFEKISDHTVRTLGRAVASHPRKYYVSNIVIPPVSIRPHHKTMPGAKTHKPPPIVDFIRNLIKKVMILPPGDSARMENALFLNRLFFDMIRGGKKGGSDGTNALNNPGNESLLAGLSGKKGRIRNHQMGHRGLHSARMTISGNPTIKLDELGVPLYIQRKIHISETVQNFNKDRLSASLAAGLIVRVQKHGIGAEKTISEKNRLSVILENGDVVFRNIEPGDLFNFNRQPSLRETSICTHKAIPFISEAINTFQINVSVCSNYNADFDGDQMNLKPLRSLRSIAEAKYLSSPNRFFLSVKGASAENGQVQDGRIGSALITRDGVVLDKLHAMRCFTTCRLDKLPVFTKDRYTGRELISLLLTMYPISYRGKAGFYNESYKEVISYSPTEINVEIKNGKVLSGILDTKAVGDGQGSIFHLIAKEHGSSAALSVLFSYQQIVISYLSMVGLTMGLDDIVVPKEVSDLGKMLVSDKVAKSELLAEQKINGKLLPPLGSTMKEYYESLQMNTLAPSQDMQIVAMSGLATKTNGWFQMISYKSKGGDIKLLQTLANVGQSTLENERLFENLSPHRSSCYYPRYAVSPEARGFVRSAYADGITAGEMAMNSVGARAQLITKQMATAITGTLMRVHIKNMESCVVDPMRHVVKAQMLLQFIYGDDGMDPRHLVKIQLVTVNMNDEAIRKRFTGATEREISLLISDRDNYRKMMVDLSLTSQVSFTDRALVSVDVGSIVTSVVEGVKSPAGAPLDKMREMVEEFVADLGYVFLNDGCRKRKGYLPKHLSSAALLVGMLCRIELTTPCLQLLTLDALNLIFDRVKWTMLSCMASPGLSCGVLAAQSVGEPLTQTMLNAIHGANAGARDIVPKIKNTIGAKPFANESKSMNIRLKEPFCYQAEAAKELAARITGIHVNDLVRSWQVFLDPKEGPVHPEYREEGRYIADFIGITGRVPDGVTGWCIRLGINKTQMLAKDVELTDIALAILSKNTGLWVVCSSDTDANPFIRVYVMETAIPKGGMAQYVTGPLLSSILKCIVRGVPGIVDAKVMRMQRASYLEDGTMEMKQEHYVQTRGCDFFGVVGFGSGIIDVQSLTCSDSTDILKIFGIEAARKKIIDQLGTHTNIAPHHLMMYASTMCWSGGLVGIEKASLKEKNKTLLRASTYGAGKVLSAAARFGIKENVSQSISSQIMLGTTPKVGTHSFDLLIDEEFVRSKTKGTLELLEEL